jgi:hypothetical protein
MADSTMYGAGYIKKMTTMAIKYHFLEDSFDFNENVVLNLLQNEVNFLRVFVIFRRDHVRFRNHHDDIKISPTNIPFHHKDYLLFDFDQFEVNGFVQPPFDGRITTSTVGNLCMGYYCTMGGVDSIYNWGVFGSGINTRSLPISTGIRAHVHLRVLLEARVICSPHVDGVVYGTKSLAPRTLSIYRVTKKYPKLLLRDGHCVGNFPQVVKEYYSKSLPLGRYDPSPDVVIRWGAVTLLSLLFDDDSDGHNVDRFIVDITPSTTAESVDDDVRMTADDPFITTANDPFIIVGSMSLVGPVEGVVEGGFDPTEHDSRQSRDNAFSQECLPLYYGESCLIKSSDTCYEICCHQGLLIIGVATFRLILTPRSAQHHHILTTLLTSLLLRYEFDGTVWGDVWREDDVCWNHSMTSAIWTTITFIIGSSVVWIADNNAVLLALGNDICAVDTDPNHVSWNNGELDTSRMTRVVINALHFVPDGDFSKSLSDTSSWYLHLVSIATVIQDDRSLLVFIMVVVTITATAGVLYCKPSLLFAYVFSNADDSILVWIAANAALLNLGSGCRGVDTFFCRTKSSSTVCTFADIVFSNIDLIDGNLPQDQDTDGHCCGYVYDGSRITPMISNTTPLILRHIFTHRIVVGSIIDDVSDGLSFLCHPMNNDAYESSSNASSCTIQVDREAKYQLIQDIETFFETSPWDIAQSSTFYVHHHQIQFDLIQLGITECIYDGYLFKIHHLSNYIGITMLELITLHVARHALRKKLRYNEEHNADCHASLFTSDKMIGNIHATSCQRLISSHAQTHFRTSRQCSRLKTHSRRSCQNSRLNLCLDISDPISCTLRRRYKP